MDLYYDISAPEKSLHRVELKAQILKLKRFYYQV